jgi:hypothetical protein
LLNYRTWDCSCLRELTRIRGEHPIYGFNTCIDVSQPVLERLSASVTHIQLIELCLDLTPGPVQIIELIGELSLLGAKTLIDSARTRRGARRGDRDYGACGGCRCRYLEQAILTDDLTRDSAAPIIYGSHARISSVRSRIML